MESKELRTTKLRTLLLHEHNSPISLSIHEKIKIIEEVINITAYDPAQGSKEWVSERQIGGSDTSSVMGKGYYGKGFFDVIKDKIFGSSFTGNLATRFGRVMEEVSRKFIEKIFNTHVWELKSLPNQLPYTSYSPDGVAVAQLFGRLMMLLLEFKTPLSRIPDGKIPKEYLPQIKAGMCAIPMVEGSLFVNSMLRLCSLRDFKYNFEYNTNLHKSDTTTCKSRPIPHKSKLDNIVAFGMTVLVQNEIQYKNSLENADNAYIDPLLTELGLNEGKVSSSYGNTFIVFDSGPSLEDELLRGKVLSITKTLNNIYRTINLKKRLYSRFAKITNIPPNYLETSKNIDSTIDSINDLEFDNLFEQSLLYENEKEYGAETETTIDSILNYVDNKMMLDAFHIPPFIVSENLGRMEIFQKCGWKSQNINPDKVTADVRIYFLESMEHLRNQLKEQNVKIVGVIPYKIFKMDIIYQPNDEPQFIQNLKPQIDKYAEIKTKCAAIDKDNSIDIEEKNNRKWNIVYEYFPDKKSKTNEEIEVSRNDLLSKLNLDDSMF